MLELAITQGIDFIRYTRNAKAIELPDGSTVMGPLRTLPHVVGNFAIRQVVVDGPEPGPLEIGGTEPPVVDGGVVVIRRTVQPMAVEQAAEHLTNRKADARAEVDRAAEAARLRFLTPGSAQAMVYGQKEAEARALKAAIAGATLIDHAAYPHLAAEVGVTAPSIEAVADVILAMAGQWLQISALIEGQRLSAKAAVTAASDLAAIDAILDDLEWPAP